MNIENILIATTEPKSIFWRYYLNTSSQKNLQKNNKLILIGN